MKKYFISLISLIPVLLMAIPVYAGCDIVGIYYNFNAQPSEAALTIDWEGTQKPDMVIKGDQFSYKGNEQTLSDIELRIENTVSDVLITKENINQLPSDDPARQNPPVLFAGQHIVGNQLYTYLMYFKIHIFSLDNVSTPQSELKFVTIFADPRAFPDGIPDNWWQ